MPRSIVLALLALTLATLGGCEGRGCSAGTVVDALTGAPLADVRCRELAAREEVTTDATGAYRACSPIGGCGIAGLGGHCPYPVVEFSKVGYATRTIENPGSTVPLDPSPATSLP